MKLQAPPRERKKILIVDDQAGFAPLLQRFMPQYEIRRSGGFQRGLRRRGRVEPSLFLIDLMLPDLHGCELAARCGPSRLPKFRSSFLSAGGLTSGRWRAGAHSRYPAFGKPFNLSALKKHIGLCLRCQASGANARLEEGWIAGD